MLDLDRCPFLRPTGAATAVGQEPSSELGCWASTEPRDVSLTEQRERCLTTAHTNCPLLLAAVSAEAASEWRQMASAARVVAESCYLAQARLEVQAERLGPALSAIFGGAR